MVNEGLANARVDYGWNAESEPEDRGFGFVTDIGFQNLELSRNVDAGGRRRCAGSRPVAAPCGATTTQRLALATTVFTRSSNQNVIT